jgi:hypothetical protein
MEGVDVQPIIDMAALSRLAADTGSSRAATSFVSRFTDLLDERILGIERSFKSPDHDQWYEAVEGLQAAAATAGAGRIQATTALLLAPDRLDAGTALGLIGQLRSDARVFTMAHSALCEEQAFADRLATRRPA